MTLVWLNTKENKYFIRYCLVSSKKTEIGYTNSIGQRLVYVIEHYNNKPYVLNSWSDRKLLFKTYAFDRYTDFLNKHKWSLQRKVSNWLIRLANSIYKK